MEFYILDPHQQSAADIERLRKEDKYPLCPVCHSELTVVLSTEEAQQKKEPPGIRCPNDRRHYESVVYLASAKRDLWAEFDKKNGRSD